MTTFTLKKVKTLMMTLKHSGRLGQGDFLGEYVFLESFKSHFCRQPPILFRGIINRIHYSFTFFSHGFNLKETRNCLNYLISLSHFHLAGC